MTGNRRTEYVSDISGSVIAEVSGKLFGNNVTAKNYTPFGETDSASGFGYKGEYYDATTGQVYLRARFYTPEIGRFSQKDIEKGAITDAISLNRYAYCQNDPVNFIDPSGMVMKNVMMADGGGRSSTKKTVPAPTQPNKTISTKVNNTSYSASEYARIAMNENRINAKSGVVSSVPKKKATPASPTVCSESISSTNSLWESIQQAQVLRSQQQIAEAEAMSGLTSGAGNALIRSGIDFFKNVTTWLFPKKSCTIERNADRWEDSVERFTRSLGGNEDAYNVGQLLGDAGITLFGIFELKKAASGLLTGSKNLLDLMANGLNSGSSFVAADGPMIGASLEDVAAAAQPGNVPAILAALFNLDNISEDWSTVKQGADAGDKTEPSSDLPSSNELPEIKLDTQKLQHEYKHAHDFGVEGNWNTQKSVEYKQAIQKHIESSDNIFKSTYRGSDVYVYYDSATGIGAYTDLDGNYIGGWKFSQAQIEYHITNGIVIQ